MYYIGLDVHKRTIKNLCDEWKLERPHIEMAPALSTAFATPPTGISWAPSCFI
jgi:hypothetical protein